jgi:hypothetical protein
MGSNRAWAAYPAAYRAREMQILTGWIAAGESGSVVGLLGSGRSNLLGFLCHRPDVLQHYLPQQADRVLLIPVDVYDLPANDLSTLYRTILHAFYWIRDRFDQTIAQTITQLYLENRAVQDPFLSQKALYELFLLFQKQQYQVVLILNRFDRFCQTVTPQMINTLRGLRDNFKSVLSYIVGLIQEIHYLPDPAALGDMYDLLDSHVCWVGALTEADARYMLKGLVRTASSAPDEPEVCAMLALSGRFPSLLRVVSHWWLRSANRPARIDDWGAALLADNSIQYRLERIWNGLTQEEKLALSEVQKLNGHSSPRNMDMNDNGVKQHLASYQSLADQQQSALARLEAKGLCHPAGSGWQITSELLSSYIGNIEGRVRGKIWLDDQTRTIYQGQYAIDELTGLQYEILRFLIKNPRIRHTRDDIIDNVWPEVEQREGITPNALQVHIASIRKKIEPSPATPHYLITWHGRPGGYQFFPEGKPE